MLVSFVLLGVCTLSCVEDFSDRDPPDDPPVQFDLESHVDADSITVRNPAFVFVFDDYLDARSSDFDRTFQLSSGSHQPFLDVVWDPSRRRITVAPLDPLRPTLRYALEANLEALSGLGGRQVEGQTVFTFVVTADATVRPEAAPPDPTYNDDVAPLLWEHCGCHWEPESQLGRLDFGSLRARATERPGRRLVEPYDAADSYLLEKVLTDYANRFGTEMPPPWSDETHLSDDEVRLIRDWIAAGAAE